MGRHSLFKGKEPPPIAALLTKDTKERLRALALEARVTVSDFLEAAIKWHGNATVKTLKVVREKNRAKILRQRP